MSKNFCDYLVSNDWAAVKKEVNAYLNTVDKNSQEDSITSGFKKWLLNNNCIKEVEIKQGLIETYPPIKIFVLKVATPNEITEKTIGIQISKTILRAHIY